MLPYFISKLKPHRNRLAIHSSYFLYSIYTSILYNYYISLNCVSKVLVITILALLGSIYSRVYTVEYSPTPQQRGYTEVIASRSIYLIQVYRGSVAHMIIHHPRELCVQRHMSVLEANTSVNLVFVSDPRFGNSETWVVASYVVLLLEEGRKEPKEVGFEFRRNGDVTACVGSMHMHVATRFHTLLY